MALDLACNIVFLLFAIFFVTPLAILGTFSTIGTIVVLGAWMAYELARFGVRLGAGLVLLWWRGRGGREFDETNDPDCRFRTPRTSADWARWLVASEAAGAGGAAPGPLPGDARLTYVRPPRPRGTAAAPPAPRRDAAGRDTRTPAQVRESIERQHRELCEWRLDNLAAAFDRRVVTPAPSYDPYAELYRRQAQVCLDRRAQWITEQLGEETPPAIAAQAAAAASAAEQERVWQQHERGQGPALSPIVESPASSRRASTVSGDGNTSEETGGTATDVGGMFGPGNILTVSYEELMNLDGSVASTPLHSASPTPMPSPPPGSPAENATATNGAATDDATANDATAGNTTTNQASTNWPPAPADGREFD